MKTTTLKPRAKLRRSIQLEVKAKAKASIEQPVIRSWAKKSALSLLNALSSVPVKKLPQPVGKK